MIYIETIADNNDIFRIERQKNKPNGNWYGIALYSDGKWLADNEIYIYELFYSLRDNGRSAMNELGLPYSKEDANKLKKLIKQASKLGWFNEVQAPKSVVKF